MPVSGRVNQTPFEDRLVFSRAPILMEYEAPKLGYRVLARPLNDIPVTTVSYENSYFHQARIAYYWSSRPNYF